MPREGDGEGRIKRIHFIFRLNKRKHMTTAQDTLSHLLPPPVPCMVLVLHASSYWHPKRALAPSSPSFGSFDNNEKNKTTFCPSSFVLKCFVLWLCWHFAITLITVLLHCLFVFCISIFSPSWLAPLFLFGLYWTFPLIPHSNPILIPFSPFEWDRKTIQPTNGSHR